ncbi:hypothetical protein L204_102112 [Cryptococcus depauperatus]|nr:hypothetical protein L204_04599 [Cryptococcus depauperatus CBS 7855]
MVLEIERHYGLTGLPPEILYQIASLLDIKSALHLAQVSRALQAPAESRLWRKLVVTRWNILANTTSLFNSGLLPPEKIGHDLLSDPEAWILSSQELFERLLSMLKSCSRRRAYIKELNVQPEVRIPVAFIELLDELAPVLETLHIDFPFARMGFYRMAPRPPPLPRFTSLLGIIKGLHNPLTSLRNVSIHIENEDCGTLILALLRAAPNLESLYVSMDIPYVQYRTCKEIYNNLPSLSSLKSLIMQRMNTCVVRSLVAVVRNAPNLEHVALRDSELRWNSEEKYGYENPLLVELSQLKRLRKLEIGSNCFDSICELSGFAALEDLSVIWSILAVMEREQLENLVIPTLPNLRRYHFNLSIYVLPPNYLIEDFVEPHHIFMRLLASNGLCQLANAPMLSIIHCPDHLQLTEGLNDSFLGEFATEETEMVEARDPAFQGLMVRSYRGEEGEIIHCRSRVRLESYLGDRDSCLIDKSGWEDHAFLNGKRFPIQVLAAIYSVEGITLDEHIVGRGFNLGEKGWNVLREWQMSNGSWGQ